MASPSKSSSVPALTSSANQLPVHLGIHISFPASRLAISSSKSSSRVTTLTPTGSFQSPLVVHVTSQGNSSHP
ncbi:hypothetical protein DSO57_1006701 [Entomophthora muscae]|uniref:Uncharacterized protein n=1 Tax=Entomophthora muscae TaxID=34485 RepID=A0ACC2UHH8_9FUNG|nr:hypothetical protein DSO57_1006701 [Entomophthora muscae]